MRNNSTLEALFPKVRSKVLAATVGQPDREWYLTELASFLETQPSSLQREIESLSKAGILAQRRDGRRLYLRADTQSPVFLDLQGLFSKTAGVIPMLRTELAALGDQVHVAFVYGSMARSEERPESDIDLLVIGEAGLSDLLPILRKLERSLGRPVNPSVYTLEEFRRKVRRDDHFLSAILREPKQFVKGSEHDLEAMPGKGRGQTASNERAGAE